MLRPGKKSARRTEAAVGWSLFCPTRKVASEQAVRVLSSTPVSGGVSIDGASVTIAGHRLADARLEILASLARQLQAVRVAPFRGETGCGLLQVDRLGGFRVLSQHHSNLGDVLLVMDLRPAESILARHRTSLDVPNTRRMVRGRLPGPVRAAARKGPP